MTLNQLRDVASDLSFSTSSVDIAEVEVSAIAFSKDGHKLITASSEPDFRLVSFCFSQSRSLFP